MGKLFVVLTSGNIAGEAGPEPGRACRQRLATALGLLVPEDGDRMAIVGGQRNRGKSEAQVAFDWLTPEQQQQVAACLAYYTCTAGDMVCLAQWLKARSREPEFEEVVVISHPWHARLAVHSLCRLAPGTRALVCPSGELAPFGTASYLARWLLTILDPSWSGPLTWPLRLVSRRRAHGI